MRGINGTTIAKETYIKLADLLASNFAFAKTDGERNMDLELVITTSKTIDVTLENTFKEIFWKKVQYYHENIADNINY